MALLVRKDHDGHRELREAVVLNAAATMNQAISTLIGGATRGDSPYFFASGGQCESSYPKYEYWWARRAK
jgi:hypothetical protein